MKTLSLPTQHQGLYPYTDEAIHDSSGFFDFSSTRNSALEQISPQSGAVHRKNTILIVEERQENRMLISEILIKNGYDVLEACNGKGGLKILQDSLCKIDLLLMDLIMTGMDGLEFIQRVRRHSSQLKILFISRYRRMRAETFEGQKVDFIEKTDHLSGLVLRVNKLLEKRPSILSWFGCVS